MQGTPFGRSPAAWRRTTFLGAIVALCAASCLPVWEWDVSSDGRVAIPCEEGLFIFDPATLAGSTLHLCGADSDLEPRLAAWSPDDARIACTMQASIADGPDVPELSTTYELWLCDARSGKRTPLYKTGSEIRHVSWTPDGSEILLAEKEAQTADNAMFATCRLLTVNPAMRLVTERLKGTAGIHAWSPDGKHLAYLTARPTARQDVFSGTVGLYDTRANTTTFPIHGLCRGQAAMLRWAPDSSRLLLAGIAAAKNPGELPPPPDEPQTFLYTYDLASGTLARWGSQPARHGAWNPTGTAFLAARVPATGRSATSSPGAPATPAHSSGPAALGWAETTLGELELVIERQANRTTVTSQLSLFPSVPVWLSDSRVLYHGRPGPGGSGPTPMFLYDAATGRSHDITASYDDVVRRQIAARRPALLDRIRTGEPQVAWKACRTLARLADPQDAAVAREHLASDPRSGLRVACADWLVQTAGEKAIPTLISHVHDPDARVRVRCVGHLGRLKAAEARITLQKLLEMPDPRTVEEAARALESIGDPAAIPALAAAMHRATAGARNACERAIRNLSDQQTLRAHGTRPAASQREGR